MNRRKAVLKRNLEAKGYLFGRVRLPKQEGECPFREQRQPIWEANATKTGQCAYQNRKATDSGQNQNNGQLLNDTVVFRGSLLLEKSAKKKEERFKTYL